MKKNIDVYIILLVIVVILLVLFYFNFVSVLNFKYVIDYVKTEEDICNASRGAKFEVDTKKYKISQFLYDSIYDVSYFRLQEDFKNSFYVYVTFYTILCVTLVLMFYPYIVTMYKFYLILFIVYVAYTTVNGLIVKNFQEIESKKKDEQNHMRIYFKLYKILNAFLISANILNEPMEYVYDKMNYKSRTFDDIIKKHIGSHYDESNMSKILLLKEKLINNLDIAKVLVFDKYSPYYIKYFDNMYVINTTMEHVDDKIYLQDIYEYRNSNVNFEKVRGEFNNISQIISHYSDDSQSIPIETNNTYKKIKDIIDNYPIDAIDIETQYKNIWNMLSNIDLVIQNDKQLNAYDKKLYIKTTNRINGIKQLLYSQKNNQVYDKINEDIKNLLKKNGSIDVEGGDYIDFFFKNKDLIMCIDDENSFKLYNDIYDLLKNQSNYIYAYIVFMIILMLSIMHSIYVRYDHYTYISTISSFIILFALIMYFRSSTE